MTKLTAMIVDDEPDIRDLLEITLSRMGLNTVTAGTLAEGIAGIQKHTPNVCLTDMNLPDGKGIELVQWIQQHSPNTPVAVITAYGSMDIAIESLKAGAFDFVSKPVELPQLRELINAALKLAKNSEPAPEDNNDPGLLLSNSAQIQTLRNQARKLARSQAPIFIQGESGSGKELVARTIHQQGPRCDGPFIAVNCGAIPSELMENEFFGHKKGSFTEAVDNNAGLFQSANGGTLFLDEIADLPLPMQVKLLRAIQEKAVRPVGDSHEVPVDIRVLSATHKDLPALVQNGLFRQDLFYRINVIEIRVPPLRERRGDVALLARHILLRIARECECTPIALTDAAVDYLKGYYFPGNVRELENILERAFTLCDGDAIDSVDLQLGSPNSNINSPLLTPAAEMTTTADIELSEPDLGLEEYLENIERKAIEQALEVTRWNKTAAAKKLGISFRALRYKLKKLGLE